jgi:hypothetical protein
MSYFKNFNLLPLILSVGIVSCSSYQRPESFQDKMERFNAKSKYTNTIPDIKIDDSLFKGRKMASIKKKRKKKELTPMSNKRLYFLTLFQQYNQLRPFSKIDSPNVSICPNFHTAILDHKNRLESKFGEDKKSYKFSYTSKLSDGELKKIPEMYLPLNKEGKTPSVFELYKRNKSKSLNKLVSKALGIHLGKTFKELTELCEYGSSDNYYAYENLATHIKTDGKLSASKSSLKILFKTTLFSNKALIKSFSKIKGRTPASEKEKSRRLGSFFTKVVNRLGVDWAVDYINTYQ